MHASRGQATVELLIILAVLFMLLMFSLQIFADQHASVNQRDIVQSAQRNAELLAQSLAAVLNGPPLSSVRVFIPVGVAPQTIRVGGGVVEVQSAGELASVSIPAKDLNTSTPLTDGNFVTITRTLTSVIITGGAG